MEDIEPITGTINNISEVSNNEIDTVLSYCTNDFRFMESNLREAVKFSKTVIVPICDKMFDGSPENKDLLDKTYELGKISPKIKFIEYKWDKNECPRFHHNMSRWLGKEASSAKYVLFLDADEIMEGDQMKKYLERGDHIGYDVTAFECYWYFREPIYRATATEMAASLWRREICSRDVIFSRFERWSYRFFPHLKAKEHEKLDGKIICHHYSWVRTKEDMLKKTSTWGHRHDRSWSALVEEEFSHDFNGTDFIHGYNYTIVDNQFHV